VSILGLTQIPGLPSQGVDILGRVIPLFGGAFSADAAVVTFAGTTVDDQGNPTPDDELGGGIGLLTQQLGFQYQQNLFRLYEIGTPFTYFVAGRAAGYATLARILGPRPLLFGFYALYGNVCNAGSNIITFAMAQGCVSSDVILDPNNVNLGDIQAQDTFRYMYLVGCVIQSLGFSSQAENMMINEQTQLMYVALLPEEGVP
jgi:hypothetical protein